MVDAALGGFDVPEPDEGFADRVIRNAARDAARDAGLSRNRAPIYAVAATIAAIGIAIGSFLGQGPPEISFEVAMAPYEDRMVEVVIDAAVAREQAMLTISLAEHLELTGFPEQRVVQWQTNLAEGKNLLALPLRLKREDDSHFTVEMAHGDVNRTMHVEVRAQPQRRGLIGA